jgi:uncharacterized protein YrrD
MSEARDVSPISLLTGMTVVSLASGNKLGQIIDLLIDPINGVLLGATLSSPAGIAKVLHGEIYSFGRDAVMLRSDESVAPLDADESTGGWPAGRLIGTKIITESGDVLGQITNIFVTLKPPPRVLYEARQSILDKLLGREFFVPASVGHAISDNAERLIVPDITAELAVSDLGSLVAQEIEVRSFDPAGGSTSDREDDTIVIDEDETVVRLGDDDDTVLRRPRHA